MRIEATDQGDETKANTAKIMGNSSYGKLLQNPERYKRVVLVEDDEVYRYMYKNTLESHHRLETETGNKSFSKQIILYDYRWIFYK